MDVAVEVEAEVEAAAEWAAEEAEATSAEEAPAAEYYIPPEEMEDIEKRLEKNVGPIASGYLSPYIQRSQYLDTVFGIRREDDGNFMIANSPLSVD